MRVYFYQNGKELVNYKHNNKVFIGNGGFAIAEDGSYIKGTAQYVVAADYASISQIQGEIRITADDFDQETFVKIWYPKESPFETEILKLV